MTVDKWYECQLLFIHSTEIVTPFSTSSPLPDVALSSGLLCHDPSSPTQGCCSDGAVLLGGFGGPLHPNLTVSSVEYLGPEEEHPPPGRTISLCQLINELYRAAEATDEGKWISKVSGCLSLSFIVDQYESVWDCCDQSDKMLETSLIGLDFMLFSCNKSLPKKKNCCC